MYCLLILNFKFPTKFFCFTLYIYFFQIYICFVIYIGIASNEQQDVNEFNNLLLSYLEEQLKQSTDPELRYILLYIILCCIYRI